MLRLVLVFYVALLFSGCATSSRSYKVKKQTPETATVVGTIKVLVNGSQKALTDSAMGACELRLNNDGKRIKYKLFKSGKFILNAKPGTLILHSIKCSTGIFSESSHVFYSVVPASVLEKGKINYIGDVTINWKLGKSKVSWGELLLTRGSTGVHRYGPLDMKVEKSHETLGQFLKKYPDMNDQEKTVKLIKFLDGSKVY